MTLEELFAGGGYCQDLRELYLVPLGSAIWSADPATFSEIPASTLVRFFENHGMLRLRGRPQWRTVTGGAQHYVEALERATPATFHRSVSVEKIARSRKSVSILSDRGLEEFDALVLAVHSDQALRLLGDPSRAEQEILGSIRYAENVATLHTDSSMLPRRRSAWASWNAFVPSSPAGRSTLTYWMNRLQGLQSTRQICLSLNRGDQVDRSTVIGEWVYQHPVFDQAAISAQGRLNQIQGRRRTWYCGAYWGYGFHEDGVASAFEVCKDLGASRTGRGQE
jgi:predicted NAD/FAD-binding protein